MFEFILSELLLRSIDELDPADKKESIAEYLIVVYKYTHMWKFITMMHTYSELCLDV